MDTRTHYIVSAEQGENYTEAMKAFLKPMEVEPTKAQMLRNPPRIGRNEPCPCGSGVKFKKCCMA